MADCIIKIEHLKKAYDNITPINDICCEIKKGEVIAIIGGSGTGKTTFIRMINALEKPTSGKIFVDGDDITSQNVNLNKLRQKVGMVFQSYNLFPHLTIIENLMLAPVKLNVATKKEAYEKALKLLNKVGLENKAYSYPRELSGGQKQRVAIARTLAMNPEIILFDEPTSALDPTMTLEIKKVINKLKEDNLTMLIVTHSMEFAKKVATRIFYLDEGIIYEEGTPEEIFDNPKKKKTIDFIKKKKSFELLLNSDEYDFVDASSKLEKFLIDHNVDDKKKQNIELAFEEICEVNILSNKKLLSENNNKINLFFTLDYELEKEQATMFINYSGKKYSIEDFEETISKNIIKNLSDKIEYTYNSESYLNNEIKIVIE